MLTIGRIRFPLLLVSLVTSLLQAQDAWKPDTQIDNFLFNLPDGWKKIDGKDGPTLIPKNLPKGGACFIGFLPSQVLHGSLRTEFNAKWSEWQSRFKVSQAGAISSEHHKNGFDLVRIDARVYNSQLGYSEFVLGMAQVGKRAEGYYWINNTGYYSYRDSLEQFEQSLQFANNPSAPVISRVPAPGAAGGLRGLYVGYKTRGLAGLHTHFEYLVFFNNGNVIRYLPEEGLEKFDFGHAVRTSRDYCGRYEIRNGQVSIVWGNNDTEVAAYSGKSLKIGGNIYFPAPDVTGLKLSGIYRREGVDLARYGIEFSPDGHFAENGMLSLLAYEGSNAAAGRGTYSIDNYTLGLNYSDGRKISFSFFVFPEDQLQSRDSIHVNTYLLMFRR